MRFIGIIPARYNSTRFPGKPLAKIDGKPMIQHVYERAKEALKEVYVATDDKRIYDVVQGFGGMAILTSADCRNGTERCIEVVKKLHLPNPDDTIIVNIQGDEPLITKEDIISLFDGRTLIIDEVPIITLISKISDDDLKDPNCVKVTVNGRGRAINFSRERILNYTNYKHIGLYAYRASTLLQLSDLDVEIVTDLEQVEWMEYKKSIQCVYIDYKGISVNVPDDILKVENYLTMEKVKQIFAAEAKAVSNIPISKEYRKIIDIIWTHVHQKGGKLITSGMGKAGQVAHDIATTFSSTGTPAIFLHPSEAQHGDLGVLQINDVLLFVSNSGETEELLKLLLLRNNIYPHIPLIVITGNRDSELAGCADVRICTGHPDEVCPLGLTPTTSTTVMSAIGDALVVLMMEEIGFTKEEYAKRHHGGYIGKQLKNG